MPRNLTDLMERAVSSAPHEPHPAADITRLAERHQRRRTTWIAGAAVAAVVAASGGVVALTRGGPGTPEPAGPITYGQQIDESDAVPASSVPGFRELHYAVPPVDPNTGQDGSIAEYRDIDADGRLVVEQASRGGDQVGESVALLENQDSTSSSVPAATLHPGRTGPTRSTGSRASSTVGACCGTPRLRSWTRQRSERT